MSLHKFTVEELKTRLDKFLSERFSDLAGEIISRGKIQRDIEAGGVTVNYSQRWKIFVKRSLSKEMFLRS